MTHSSLVSWIRSTAIAAIAASVMLALLIISAEEIPTLKNWLKATFYHHWLGKGVLAIGLFVVISVALRLLLQRGTSRLSTLIVVEAIMVILSACVIAGFFLLHTLGLV